jgi:thioredoxin reductase (NADPH)
MTAALYLLRSGVEMVWIEKLAPGGQVLMTEEIENYPGFPKGVKGYELIDLFAEHVAPFTFDKITDEVTAMEHQPGNVRLQVGGEEWIEVQSAIICTGAEYKRLGLPGEKEYTGRGVSYCALCDGNFFRDQTVAVVGGGNSALEESLYLAKLVKKLYLIHRRDQFRGAKVYADKVFAHPKIETLLSYTVNEIQGDQSGVTGIVVESCKDAGRRTLEVDGLFVFVGFQPLGGFFPETLELDKAGFVVTDTEMHTNLEGVYAAGDIRSKNTRQVTTAVGDGATAANSVFSYLEQLNA